MVGEGARAAGQGHRWCDGAVVSLSIGEMLITVFLADTSLTVAFDGRIMMEVQTLKGPHPGSPASQGPRTPPSAAVIDNEPDHHGAALHGTFMGGDGPIGWASISILMSAGCPLLSSPSDVGHVTAAAAFRSHWVVRAARLADPL